MPVVLPAYTDSRAFRDAFPECVAYGFFPQRDMTLFEMWPLCTARTSASPSRTSASPPRCYRDIAQELLG